MNRFVRSILPALLALVILAPMAQAQQAVVGPSLGQTGWSFSPLWMRNTTAGASTVAREANWARWDGGVANQVSNSAFTDSLVYRHGALITTDTTAALRLADLPFPPSALNTPLGVAATDSVPYPWLVVRVRADTANTVYSFSGRSASLDTIRVGAQYSFNGINWLSVTGTPTINFDATATNTGEDGKTTSSGFALVPNTTVDGYAQVVLKCNPTQYNTSSSPILNKTLCMCGAQYIRFLVTHDGTGQFVTELGSWRRLPPPNQ